MPEEPYTKVVALYNLVRPWIEHDLRTGEQFINKLATRLAELRTEPPPQTTNAMVSVSDGEVKVLWPIVDQDGNYWNPSWRWPNQEAEE